MRVELALLTAPLTSSTDCVAIGIGGVSLSQIGVVTGSHALLETSTVSRVVQLRCVATRESTPMVYLPSSLAALYDRTLLLNRFLSEPRPRSAATVTPLATLTEQCATKVYLRRMGMPSREFSVTSTRSISLVEDLMTEALRQFFAESRKIVAEGDVLTVPLPMKRRWEDDHGGVRYFKVAEVEPHDVGCIHFVDPQQTRVARRGDVCSGFLPVEMEVSVKERGEVERVMGPALPHWKELARIVVPTFVSGRQLSYRLGVLLHGAAGKTVAITEAAKALGMKCVLIECLDIQYSSVGDVYQQLTSLGTAAAKFSPCFLVLRHIQYLSTWLQAAMKSTPTHSSAAVLSSALHDLTQQSGEDPEKSVILIGTCDTPHHLAPSIRHTFTHELPIPPLNEEQKLDLLHHYVEQFEMQHRFDDIVRSLHLVSDQMVTSSPRDVYSISCHLLNAAQQTKTKLTVEAVEEVLTEFHRRPGSHKNVAEIPKVEWSDIGGLEDVKKLIKETVELPIKHRSLFASGLHKRLGVLLHGPPGVGKTLLAKAIATECKTKFMSIKGPELLDMYVGETERLVRDLFDRAKKASPCVLFFDELDAFVPARGAEDSGAVMDRVVSQFLAELDVVSAGQHDVFVFGATNRIDLIDPALLRPGRLDKLVEVSLPNTIADKYSILQSLTRKFNLAEDIDLATVAHRVQMGASGADLYAICADAWTKACKRHISLLPNDQEASEVIVCQRDFEEAADRGEASSGEP